MHKMRTERILSVLFCVSIGVGFGAPANLSFPMISPSAITIGTMSSCTVTVKIVDRSLIPGSVNLQRIDSNTGAVSVLGTLHDDGANGDPLAGDGMFSITVPLTGQQQGKIQMRISAAFQGALRRVTSPNFALDVMPAGIPLSTTPPDLNNLAIDPTSGMSIVAGRLNVCFRESVSVQRVLQVVTASAAKLIGRFSSGIGSCYQVALEGESLASTWRSLLAQPEVELAEPDFVGSLNTIQIPYNFEWPFTRIHSPQAQEISTGEGVIVAVVDTGVDYTHSSLQGRITKGINETTLNPFRVMDPLDDYGHGTHVAGIVLGVAPRAQVLAVKSFLKGGACVTPLDVFKGFVAKWGSVGMAEDGITWSVDHGAKVINMSFGFPDSAMLKRAIDYAKSHDVVLVASAGNEGSSIRQYPAAYEGVVSVGSTDFDGKRSWFSNFGDWVKIGAPVLTLLQTF